ncbi:hypothetical protein JQT66_16930 [Sulfitobacter mediterraneus]|uniref:hypothetical protein n=1 Tax=Sulfitobacter mediterraneus TaxID=83219 RepID=UPI0019326981|nr:hypothetical protein [Sulfitobacter mediterraneus]MBM1311926.1 hypothetical protein [Sulfitobacter mediterraneus]MBM1315807.1 hypothetical protein [Sulfitobacter mediterraneus]MBM1324169.1 hypothetical protein [Sulfitobacter mediterraneus]MBM1328081.1 hypothetical protein [Sulfitobacter mediterraneus]MBM1399429.1 hypothetical protein [Sulfitobacter mediterraneus]
MSGPYKDTARRFKEVALAANKREEQQRLAETKAKMEALIADPSWLTEELFSTPDEHSTSDVASTPAELAATHDNVIELSAFRNKKKPVIVPSFEPGWEAELRTGTYARSHSSEADGGWFPSKGNDLIKARGDRHRADFTWVGKGLEAEGVRLFVDGVRIEDVEVDLRADTNAMRLFFVLPDHIGDDVPLDRAETCLEDDGSVRVQLWTKS